MKVADVKVGMSNITLTAKVLEISESRDVQTKYGPRSVADAILEDDTGQISLSLWETQIKSIAVGDTINVIGAYSTQFREKLQITIPKNGKLEVVQ